MADIIGDASDNSLLGTDGADRLFGLDGADTLDGGAGGDLLDGGEGRRDRVSYADATGRVLVNLFDPSFQLGDADGDCFVGIEAFRGSEFNDTMVGVGETDRFIGGAGNDFLNGNDGNDTLIGGRGVDTIDGGDGADVTLFRNRRELGDTYNFFNGNEDQIIFNSLVFRDAFAAGSLDSEFFVQNESGAATIGGPQVILYKPSLFFAELRFDEDGTGPGRAITLATFGTYFGTFDASDIVIR